MSVIDDLIKIAVSDYAKYIIPVVFLGIATAVVIRFLRDKIKAFKPELEKNKYYREIVLPLSPFLISVLMAWLVKETATIGIVAGAVSGTVYQMVKGYLKRLQAEEKTPES